MTGLLHLHNLLRWVILVLLIWTIINTFLNKNGKETKILTIVSTHNVTDWHYSVVCWCLGFEVDSKTLVWAHS